MAVKRVVYSREFITRDKTFISTPESDEDLAIREEIKKNYRYRDLGLGEYEGEDEAQKYAFKFVTSDREESGEYTSSVIIRKCGAKESIARKSDLENFLVNEVEFLPRTL